MAPNNMFSSFSDITEQTVHPTSDDYTPEGRHPENCLCDCCESTATQFADISVPVEIKPSVVIGKIETECCGEPDICCRESSSCSELKLMITQKISIKIPIEYCTKVCAEPIEIKCSDCDKCD